MTPEDQATLARQQALMALIQKQYPTTSMPTTPDMAARALNPNSINSSVTNMPSSPSTLNPSINQNVTNMQAPSPGLKMLLQANKQYPTTSMPTTPNMLNRALNPGSVNTDVTTMPYNPSNPTSVQNVQSGQSPDDIAIMNAINAVKNGTAAQQPAANSPNLNANQQGQPQPSTQPPALNPGQSDASQTMQTNPQNLINALQGQSRQNQLDQLGLGFPKQ
jgi:hypothetical protein